MMCDECFKDSRKFYVLFLQSKAVTAGNIGVLTELQKRQVACPELLNLDQLVDLVTFL